MSTIINMSFSESHLYIYMLDHNALERVDTINDLGVTVTSNLSWSKNIKSIIC